MNYCGRSHHINLDLYKLILVIEFLRHIVFSSQMFSAFASFGFSVKYGMDIGSLHELDTKQCFRVCNTDCILTPMPLSALHTMHINIGNSFLKNLHFFCLF